MSTVWDVENRIAISDSLYHQSIIKTVDFSYDDKYFITTQANKFLVVLDLFGHPISSSQSYDDEFHIAKFSPTEKYIAASDQNAFYLMKFKKSDTEVIYVDTSIHAISLCFSSDGENILAGSEGSVKIINVVSKEKTIYDIDEGRTWDYRFSPDNKYFHVRFRDYILIMETETGKTIKRIDQRHIESVNWNTNGKYIVITNGYGSAKVWSINPTPIM